MEHSHEQRLAIRSLTPTSPPRLRRAQPRGRMREIDAKTHELMQEFFNHVREFQATHPGDHDPRKIYEAWSIQKLAALQFTVLQLGDAINELATLMRRK